ncbi:unnamed protein product [Rotaria sp. Silwood2]|nr:unnamed protein product [Rotaria sp. Silwood2]CAF4612327.1 unnamed protein product [Rotaria sp. Silwood2]
MEFFVRDLHQQICALYAKTSGFHSPLTVYRGQGVTKTELDEIQASKGRLMTFNNFLSTSTNRQLSLLYAESAGQNSDLHGVLFDITIDPTLTSNSFASLNNVSYNGDMEEEILFSMHTVFRIGDIEQLENGIQQVKLTLTSDDDQQLRTLTEYIRQEASYKSQWHRLAQLMLQMGEYIAEEIYQTKLDSIPNNNGVKFTIYGILEDIKRQKDD